MQQKTRNRFAPRWVMIIYIVSVMEAIGLSVYFNARISDPQVGSARQRESR